MRRHLCEILFTAHLMCVTGCSLLVNPLFEGIIVEPLDVSNWSLVELPIELSSDPCNPHVRTHNLSSGTFHSYCLPELYDTDLAHPRDPNTIRSASVNKDGVLAIATPGRVVGLARLGVGEFETLGELNARALGWSNAGDRIAVVSNDVINTLKLKIVDPDLVTLTERIVEVPTAVFQGTLFQGDPPFCVSWSPDDSRVAVSTDRWRVDDPAHCFIVDLSSDRVDRYAFSNVHFIDESTIVGNEPGPLPLGVFDSGGFPAGVSIAGRVYVLRIADGVIVSRSLLRTASVVAASYPAEKTYVTREFSVLTGSSGFASLRVRHADGRFSVILGPVDTEGRGTFGRGRRLTLIPNSALSGSE